MKYRVWLNIILDAYEDAKKVYDFLAEYKPFMRTIRKGKPAEERSRITLAECYHDEDPTRPCQVLEKFESE